MQVKGNILQYFRPSLNYHLSLDLFVLSIFEWPLYTYFTVQTFCYGLFHCFILQCIDGLTALESVENSQWQVSGNSVGFDLKNKVAFTHTHTPGPNWGVSAKSTPAIYNTKEGSKHTCIINQTCNFIFPSN